MNKDNYKKFFSFLINLTGFLLIGLLIFLIIYYASSKLLLDKKSIVIPKDEGKYILNVMAEEYEKILLQRKIDLDSERLMLLAEQRSAVAIEDKRLIEEKLKKIEKDKNTLNNEYEKNLEQKKDFEKNLKGLEKNLVQRTEEITQLNQKNLELSILNDKNQKYWADYVFSIKNSLKEIYKGNFKKINDIESNFSDPENAKTYFINDLKNLYATVFSRDDRVEKVTKEKDTEIKKIQKDSENKDKDIEKKDKELENRQKEINKLTDNFKNTEIDLNTYRDFYNINKSLSDRYEKIKDSYFAADKFYKNNDISKAVIEYNNVLSVFDEVLKSGDRLKDISVKNQNITANDLLIKARKSLSNKKYDEAYDYLSRIIKEAPLNNKNEEVISELLNIAKSTSEKDRIAIANRKVSQLLPGIDSLKLSKDYQKALDICDQLIVDYPYSDFIKKIVVEARGINTLLKTLERTNFEDELRNNFNNDFQIYNSYRNKNLTEKARKFYFEALNKTFGPYTNDTINSFKEFEDGYIENLISKLVESKK